jgi:eukaryotic-like serine/threonine-protein kinase
MPESPDREETLFLAAREITDPAERAAYLHRACGTDTALRQRMERLLAAEQAAEQLWADDPPDPSYDSGLNTASLFEGPGTVIGRYKLLEQIGEGGMGVVYMAEQEEPVRRRVALKIIKLGMDTKQVIARFEAERQALALMNHPNIAKVFDAGILGGKSEGRNQKEESEATRQSADSLLPSSFSLHTSCRPYFVMELVRGVPITRFCEENRLSIKDRLDLFIPVCHAIQHAHQKGVIHRDQTVQRPGYPR